MKRIIRYLQDQALSASQNQYSGSAYLSPSTKEPQQRVRHHSSSQKHKEQHLDSHQQSDHSKTAPNIPPPAYTAACPEGVVPDETAQSVVPRPMSSTIEAKITRHQYAQDNILQSYDVYTPENVPDQGYWIIYIHGGYFRDPSVTSTSFLPALSQLVSSSVAGDAVAGYASVNYRLSKNERFPQDPNITPKYELRDATWPEPLQDVRAAIVQLQHRYSFTKYLLVGHSVGATMALLLSTLGNTSQTGGSHEIVPPTAVLGVCGIYDFDALHRSFPSYVELTRNAIPNAQDQQTASPARHAASEFGVKAVVLAHSRDDGLVDWKQVEIMRDVFAETAHDDKSAAVSVRVVEIHGKHNKIWEEGTELARAIREALLDMRKVDETI